MPDKNSSIAVIVAHYKATLKEVRSAFKIAFWSPLIGKVLILFIYLYFTMPNKLYSIQWLRKNLHI